MSYTVASSLSLSIYIYIQLYIYIYVHCIDTSIIHIRKLKAEPLEEPLKQNHLAPDQVPMLIAWLQPMPQYPWPKVAQPSMR